MYHILYVDDEPSLLELGKDFLEKNGQFSIDIITSAPDAISLLNAKTYDAVIADYQMPEMDGIEFLRIVRSSGNTIPFILFTGRGREEVVIQALNEGADFYIQKGGDPVSQFAELAHQISRAVRQRQAEASIRDHERREADIINFLPDATFAIDTKGTVITWNLAMEKMTGVSSSEILGKGNYEYALPFYHERRPILIDLVLSDNPSIAARYPFIQRIGNTLFSEITIPHFNLGRGAALWFTASPLYDNRGEVIGAIESIRDITDHKQAEQAIAKSQEYLNQIFSSVKAGILIIDAETHRILDINPAGAEIIGLPKEKITGNTCHKFICPADVDNCPITDLHKSIDNSERVLITSKGVHIPIVKFATRITFDGRECLLETFIDNRERKQAEEELHAAFEELTATEEELRHHYDLLSKKEQSLRESEEKYRLLTEVTDDIMYLIDLQGTITHISPQISRYGYTEKEVLTRNFTEFIAKEDLPAVLEGLEKTISGRNASVTTLRVRDKAGALHWMEDNGAPVLDPSGSVVGISGILRDISRRKDTEEALRESEETFRAMVEQSGEGIIIVDFLGTLRFANSRAWDIIEYPPERRILGKLKVLEIVAPESRNIAIRDLLQVSKGIDSFPVSYKIITFEGKERWIDCIGKNISFKGSSSMLLSFRDVTDRQNMEMALRESERQYRDLFTNSVLGIFRTTPEGRFATINPTFARISGYESPEEMMAAISDVRTQLYVNPSDRTLFMEKLTTDGFVKGFEAQFYHKDGRILWIALNAIAVRDPQGKIRFFEGTIEDITQRKKAEEALRQANRQINLMTSITRHDILNHVTVLLGNLEIMDMKFTDPAVMDYLKKMETATNAIQSLIADTQLLQDLGVKEPQWQDIDRALPRREIPATIRLDADIGGVEIFADPMLKKVFFNLMDNAIRHGGHVKTIAVSFREDPDGLVIIWEDDGTGIPAEEKRKIFKRGYGKNTGLGLFLAQEILSITGLTIKETGMAGKGARFEITVPKGCFRFPKNTS
ncbi:MAG: PAS domain S-box protein [Methanoregula sp.]